MTVLGIETATAVCGAAVVRDGSLVALREREEARIHAEQLPGFIEAVLAEAGLSVEQLDGVAVSAGPGSFTGLRIGLSMAKGLVYATGTRLVGVPTMEALAVRAARSGALNGRHVMPLLHARRGEVYAQVFVVEGDGVRASDDVRDLTTEEVGRLPHVREMMLTGDAAASVSRLIAGNVTQLVPAPFCSCSAAETALIGERMLAADVQDDPVTLEPRYIKEFFLKER